MSNTMTVDMETLHNMRDDCKEQIELGDALKRLEKNPDFIKLFLQEYTEKEPIRLTRLLDEQSFNKDRETKEFMRAGLSETLLGIAKFCTYMRFVKQKADIAEKQLNNINEAEIDYFKNNKE